MPRLCDRPGCSAGAEIAFGFDAARQVAWFDELRVDDDAVRAGALCRRHAQSMVLPGGWVLDDRRQPMPQLFRTAETPAAERPPSRRRSRNGAATPVAPSPSATGVPETERRTVARPRGVERTADQGPPSPSGGPARPEGVGAGRGDTDRRPSDVPDTAEPGADDTRGMPWIPSFDPHDDLSGLLRPRGPLLTRAFLGDETSPLRRPATDGVVPDEPTPG